MRRCLAALAVVLLVASCSSDGEDVVASTTTTSSPTTSTTTTVDRTTAVWPSSSATARYGDPVAAARAFAVDFLHFDHLVVGPFQQGDARSGEVEIRPRPDGPVTTVLLRQLSGEDTWSVLGTATANIEVTAPSTGATVTSPMTVQGRALAFEGTVDVEVRQDGSDDPIGTGFVTGGGDVMRPFDDVVTFDDPSAGHGALVLETRSMEDGQMWTASVQRIAFADDATPASCTSPPAPPVGEGEMLVTVFYTCDDGTLETLVPVVRAVPESTGVLRAALDSLVTGPGDTGLVSWFSPATASMVRSVDLDGDRAVVDFGDLRSVIPNASTSAGSQMLLDQLDATVFHHPTIRSVEYRMEGSCDELFEWLQLECADRTRD